MLSDRMRLAHFYLDYSDVGAAILLLFELLIATLILRPKMAQKNEDTARDGSLYGSVFIAVLGIGLSLITIPFTPKVFQPLALLMLVTDNLLFSAKLLIPLALLVALSFLAAAVFGRMMIPAWSTKIGTITAVLAASLVFAVSWPLTSAPSAFFIGLASVLLSVRERTVFSGVLTNILGTCLCIAALIWRALAHG